MKKNTTKNCSLLKALTILPVISLILSGQILTAQDNTKSGLSSAAKNYQNYCAGCHGERLEKFAAKKWMQADGITDAVKSIKYGIDNIGMPAFEKTFTVSEINDLAAYVKKGIPADKSKLKPAVTAGEIVNSQSHKFVIETVVTGLSVPWGLVFLPDGRLLISQRAGTLHLFADGKLSAPISGLPPVMVKGQGGLLDLCLHPDHKKNGWIYLSYSALNTAAKKDIGNTAVARFKLSGNKITDLQVIFKGLPDTDRGHHFGSKLVFDKQGLLYFGIGDRGQHFDFPQKLDNHNGKIHRIKDDGSIPADNPFVKTPGALPSIYSFGHRNPQGTCLDPVTGKIWESEHGPRGGDELNIIEPGRNYGWPVISYGINYNGTVLTELKEKQGMQQPVFYWVPSIAPCGMTFVSGSRFKNWRSNILIGSLRFTCLERLVLSNNSVTHREKLLEGIGRVRNVVMGSDDLVYVAIENPGKILRLVPVE